MRIIKINIDGTILTLIQTTGKRSVKDNWRKLNQQIKSDYAVISYKYKRLLVHRVMYAKFVGKLSQDLVINHKDGNKLNNTPDNLELISQSENNTHRFRTLGHKAVYGNTNLNFEIADQIRTKKRLGKTHRELCEEYKISKGHVSEIVNNKIWVRK